MGCCCDNDNKINDIQKVDREKLKEILVKYQGMKGSLISILQEVQKEFDYLPMEIMRAISEETGINEAKILGVATFYTQFRLNPVGRYIIMLCQGTACHVNGSKLIEKAIIDELNITDGETTDDGLFTLENVACLGCCSLSPVMMINGETYGNLTPEKTRKIIKDILNKEVEKEV